MNNPWELITLAAFSKFGKLNQESLHFCQYSTDTGDIMRYHTWRPVTHLDLFIQLRCKLSDTPTSWGPREYTRTNKLHSGYFADLTIYISQARYQCIFNWRRKFISLKIAPIYLLSAIYHKAITDIFALSNISCHIILSNSKVIRF